MFRLGQGPTGAPGGESVGVGGAAVKVRGGPRSTAGLLPASRFWMRIKA